MTSVQKYDDWLKTNNTSDAIHNTAVVGVLLAIATQGYVNCQNEFLKDAASKISSLNTLISDFNGTKKVTTDNAAVDIYGPGDKVNCNLLWERLRTVVQLTAPRPLTNAWEKDDTQITPSDWNNVLTQLNTKQDELQFDLSSRNLEVQSLLGKVNAMYDLASAAAKRNGDIQASVVGNLRMG